jgi:phosphatidylserine decarboxylase
VIALRYHPGRFLNALNPASAIQNENTWIGLEEETAPHRRMVVRQISGAIARRIVCAARPGEALARGQKFGMIKLGSRTELIIPDTEDLIIESKIGQKIIAGTSVMAKYVAKPQASNPEP